MVAEMTYKLANSLPVSKKRDGLADKPYQEDACNRRHHSVVNQETHVCLFARYEGK
jgi:hypothetical protein